MSEYVVRRLQEVRNQINAMADELPGDLALIPFVNSRTLSALEYLGLCDDRLVAAQCVIIDAQERSKPHDYRSKNWNEKKTHSQKYFKYE